MEATMGTDHGESSSSTRDEHGNMLAERVNSDGQEDIAIQVKNDVIASLEKIFEDDKSITLIPRVPETLRQCVNGAYDPQVMSIGPYHWGKPQLQATEKHKRRFLVEFLNRFPGRRLEDYIEEIKSLEPRLRSCYDGDIHMTGKDFVEMMLVDACFLVELSLNFRNLQAYRSPGESWLLGLMLTDMLLLENQVPFFLLQRIYDIAIAAAEENLPRPSSFLQVALEFRCSELRMNYPNLIPKPIHHLLHLDHSIQSLTYSAQHPLFKTTQSSESESKSSCPAMRSACVHLFQMVTFDIFTPSKKAVPLLTIPSATQLSDLGIKFKIGKSPNPFHMKFHRGVMEIKPLFLNNWSTRVICNKVAFERLYFDNDPFFLQFFKFMDLLINTSNDVALLRTYDIIHHEFGSDDELALFFSQLTNGILSGRYSISSEMHDKVNEYCNIKRHRWRASLIRDYCSSPWSTLGLIVGFLLLAFTFVQSYMSLHSYFRPPHS